MPQQCHVVVVGAGLSGIAAAVKLRQAGITDLVVLEKADQVGGTWRDNTYPGCAVDIPAAIYSFSFNPNPEWSRNLVGQPELLAYIEATVRKFGLTDSIHLSTELLEASWSDEQQRWTLRTSRGVFLARHVIFASGLLTEPKIPDVPGLAGFRGDIIHSARWNHDVDLTDRRVAVIGTGCSGVQIIPELQPVVRYLHVFQRTPAWVMPRPDFSFPAAARSAFRRFPSALNLNRGASDLLLRLLGLLVRRGLFGRILNAFGRAFLRLQVSNPELRKALTPDFTVGCKRLLLSNSYLPTMEKDNVNLVPSALSTVDGHELVAADGTRVEADVIVFASGFDLRRPPIAQRIRCRDGRLLSQVWSTLTPEAYRATTIPGLPNGYLLLGPNSVTYHSLLTVAEFQLDYIVDAIRTMTVRGLGAAEVQPEPFLSYNRKLQGGLASSVYDTGGCSSFYHDERGHNFVAWPWSIGRLRRGLARFDIENYQTTPCVGSGTNGGSADV